MSQPTRPSIQGIVPPFVTPLAGPDQLDLPGMERLIEHILAGGVSGLFVLGTTGEAPSLSYRLRAEVLEVVTRQVGRRIPVLAGLTDTSYIETLRLAEAAAHAGAWAGVVAPPYYFRYSQTDLLNYIEKLTKDLPLPFFLYNIPQLTKVGFEVSTIRAAAQFPRVLGFKDSSGDLAYLAEVAAAVRDRPDFAVLIGPEEMLQEGLQAGAHGGVCGGANLDPGLFVRLFRAVQAQDTVLAQELQELARERSRLLYTVGDPSTSYLRGLKTALHLSGICSDLPALPFSPFTDAERQLLAERWLGTTVAV